MDHHPSRPTPIPDAPPQGGAIMAEADDRTADVRGTNWQGRRLGAVDLRGVKLCRADVRGADLREARLEGADLALARYDGFTRWPPGFAYARSGAVGPGAKLGGAFLNTADLRGMDLRGAFMLGVYLSGADCRGALMQDTGFANGDLRRSRFCGALLTGSRFAYAQLEGCDFRAADLRGADFSAVESIAGAVFTGALGWEDWRDELLSRPCQELDCWNRLARCTTRESLEAIDAHGNTPGGPHG
ncbi:MAG: pentapeptide repeat-containing protein [Cyanobacteria bacterium MAG IRC1_bin_28]|nr:pentapeptide repeat-containing protein [Cyanobacteria bacterium MAG IRC3_bin_20]MCY3653664.1 pentapeptide repeat-containing protein [Cyanobacteria bacterium MAG IRC1_bin_28]MDE0648301.1 pentapeptide repeat-containing protein [Cyanobacteria bacterium MAG IRC4_bin_6]